MNNKRRKLKQQRRKIKYNTKRPGNNSDLGMCFHNKLLYGEALHSSRSASTLWGGKRAVHDNKRRGHVWAAYLLELRRITIGNRCITSGKVLTSVIRRENMIC